MFEGVAQYVVPAVCVLAGSIITALILRRKDMESILAQRETAAYARIEKLYHDLKGDHQICIAHTHRQAQQIHRMELAMVAAGLLRVGSDGDTQIGN